MGFWILRGVQFRSLCWLARKIQSLKGKANYRIRFVWLMKSPAFKLISLFVQLLHFKITFSPLWMRKGKQESKFSINFLNTAFFLNRHVGIQRKYKTTGMYSVDWQTETERTLSFLFLPLVCFPFIFILKAHNTSFFPLDGKRATEGDFKDLQTLAPANAAPSALFLPTLCSGL